MKFKVYEEDGNHIPYLELNYKNEIYNFLMDTGANTSSVFDFFVTNVSVESQEKSESSKALGIGGSAERQGSLILDEFQVLGKRIHDHKFLIQASFVSNDLVEKSNKLGEVQLCGIIGNDILSLLPPLDFRSKVCRTFDQTYNKMILTKESINNKTAIYSTLIKLNNCDARMLIDTGASQSIVFAEYADEILKADKVEVLDDKATGSVGTQTLYKVNNLKIDWLNKTLEESMLHCIQFKETNDALTSIGVNKLDGIIGCDWLVKYGLVLDLENLIISQIQE